MKCKTLLCLNFLGNELRPDTWLQFDGLCATRILAKDLAGVPARQCVAVDGLLVKLGAHVDRQMMDELPNLRYIGMLGTGYGGIDTAYAASKGIMVTNIADYATQAVAELTFGMLLEHLREITRARQQTAAGDYSDNFNGSEIRGKKFGIIGLGAIGTRTAQLAQAFGADVSYWSRNRKPALETSIDIKYRELDDLLVNSEIITLNVALNPETKGILTAQRIKRIKKQAIFINLSPMELVDFGALVKRLQADDLVFMLDHSDEMTSQQLTVVRTLGNCIVYPAVGYLTREASQLKQQIYIDNLKNFLIRKATNRVN